MLFSLCFFSVDAHAKCSELNKTDYIQNDYFLRGLKKYNANLDTRVKFELGGRVLSIPVGYLYYRPRGKSLECLFTDHCPVETLPTWLGAQSYFQFWMSDLSYPKIMPTRFELRRCEEGRDETDFVVHVKDLLFFSDKAMKWQHTYRIEWAQKLLEDKDNKYKPTKLNTRQDGLTPYVWGQVKKNNERVYYFGYVQTGKIFVDCNFSHGARLCLAYFQDRKKRIAYAFWFPAEKFDEWAVILSSIQSLIKRWEAWGG